MIPRASRLSCPLEDFQKGSLGSKIGKIMSSPDPKKAYKCSNTTTSAGFTLIHKLVMNTSANPSYLKLLDVYLRKNRSKIDRKTTKGWTALHLASRNSRADSTEGTVELLLRHGADPNVQQNAGCTP